MNPQGPETIVSGFDAISIKIASPQIIKSWSRGEVKKPDSYPYVSGMTYLTAVAIAGGYTYRAKENVVYVIHASSPEQKEIETKLEESVQPGDIIHVEERFF